MSGTEHRIRTRSSLCHRRSRNRYLARFVTSVRASGEAFLKGRLRSDKHSPTRVSVKEKARCRSPCEGRWSPICALEPLTLWVSGLSSGRVVMVIAHRAPEASHQRRCRNPPGLHRGLSGVEVYVSLERVNSLLDVDLYRGFWRQRSDRRQ